MPTTWCHALHLTAKCSALPSVSTVSHSYSLKLAARTNDSTLAAAAAGSSPRAPRRAATAPRPSRRHEPDTQCVVFWHGAQVRRHRAQLVHAAPLPHGVLPLPQLRELPLLERRRAHRRARKERAWARDSDRCSAWHTRCANGSVSTPATAKRRPRGRGRERGRPLDRATRLLRACGRV